MNAPFQGSDLFLAANLENEPSRCSFLRFQPLTGDHHWVPTFPHPSQARKQARFGLEPFFRRHRPPTLLSGCCQHPNPETDVFRGWALSLAPTPTTPRELDRSLGF